MVNNIEAIASKIYDFNELLHELRTQELRNIPVGSKVFLSGGASGNWYFDWIKNNYKGIEKHIGVEAYSPMPTSLPPEVTWISNTLGDMKDVGNKTVDLVFAGQTIEHLWADELVDFLCESNRVLSNEGIIVLDSPNRRITYGINWYHPEHTMELTVSEIVELLQLAGFVDVKVKGHWLCYDRRRHRFLPLDPMYSENGWQYSNRIGENLPVEDCFSWWVEAKKSDTSPNRNSLASKIAEIYQQYLPARHVMFQSIVGRITAKNDEIYVSSGIGEEGYLSYGPYIPLAPGKYIVKYMVKCLEDDLAMDENIFKIDICANIESRIVQEKFVQFRDLQPKQFTEIVLSLNISLTTFGFEFRIYTTGAANVVVKRNTRIELVEI